MCKELIELQSETAAALDLLAQIQLTQGRLDEAIASLNSAVRRQPGDAALLRRLGNSLFAAGRDLQAAKALERAIALEPGEARAHNNLGQALARLGDAEQALSCYAEALSLRPDYAVAHNNRGLGLSQLGRHAEALQSLRRAVDLDPHWLIARINLAIEFEKADCLRDALGIYDDALRLWPDSLLCWTGRAGILTKLLRLDEALLSVERALSYQPGDPDTLLRKAALLLELDRIDECLAAVNQVLQHGDFPRGHALKGAALAKLQRLDEALRSLDVALRLDPRFVDAWCDSAVILLNQGKSELARDRYRAALANDVTCVRARAGLLASMAPAIFDSGAIPRAERSLLDEEISLLECWVANHSIGQSAALTLARQELFYLSYREISNVVFLSRYRSLAVRHLSEFFPPLRKTAFRLRPKRRRIGFVSAHVREHSVYDALLRGWLERLDRGSFETAIFYVGAMQDAVTAEAAALVDHFDGEPKNVPDWARLIAQHDCDALIFPEIGMDRTTLALASMRHAPCQYVSWGHPETSGLPTIDYFLSAADFEPEDAQTHYSERLIRLPNLGVRYSPYPSEPGNVDLETLGLVDCGCLYLCPGTPFKYAPEFDSALCAVAHRVVDCTFVFMTYPRGEFSSLLNARLARCFRQEGLDPDRYLKFIPWQPMNSFQAVLRSADVYLDSIGFSGFNTMMQAVQANLPCVAYEGRFMRGRLGSAIQKKLGMPELVANSIAAYVSIAAELGESSTSRARIKQKMLLGAAALYFDDAPIASLAELLLAQR